MWYLLYGDTALAPLALRRRCVCYIQLISTAYPGQALFCLFECKIEISLTLLLFLITDLHRLACGALIPALNTHSCDSRTWSRSYKTHSYDKWITNAALCHKHLLLLNLCYSINWERHGLSTCWEMFSHVCFGLRRSVCACEAVWGCIWGVNQSNLLAGCLFRFSIDCLIGDLWFMVVISREKKIKTNIYDVFWLPPLHKNVIISVSESVR